MSIECTNLTAERVAFGDIATDGLTAVTVAMTIRPNVAVTSGRDICGKDNAWPDHAFTLTTSLGDELAWVVIDDAAQLFGRRTAALNMVSGSLYRILCTWTNVGGQAVEIWVNGVQPATTAWWSGTPTALRSSAAPFSFGHRGYSGGNALGADYSEVAAWNHVVPQWFREAYGKGLSPRFYRKGGILYCPAWNTNHLRDEWGGVLGVNTLGTNAPHPRMYYPAPTVTPGVAVALGPPALGAQIAVAASDDHLIAVAASDDSKVAVAASDDHLIAVRGSE